MKKLIYLDIGILIISLLLMFITNFVHKQDTGMYAGLSPMVFCGTLFMMISFLAAEVWFYW